MPKKISQFSELLAPGNDDWLLVETSSGLYRKVRRSALSSAGFTLNYNNQILIDCPDIYYRFLETSGTVASDSSGFNQSGTYQAGIQLNQSPLLTNIADPSILVNGAGVAYPNPYFGAAYTAMAPGFSIEAWFQLSASNSAGFVFYWGQNNASNIFQGFGIYVTNTQIHLDVAGVTTNIYNVSIGTGLNHLVANLTKSSGSNNGAIDIYRNGVLIAQRTSNSINLPTTNAGLIGRAQYGNQLPGRIAQFAFYGAPLSPNRIVSHYKQGIKA